MEIRKANRNNGGQSLQYAAFYISLSCGNLRKVCQIVIKTDLLKSVGFSKHFLIISIVAEQWIFLLIGYGKIYESMLLG